MIFLIKNANVVLDNDIKRLDILIKDGIVENLGTNLKCFGARTIDANDLTAIPGIVDMHVHFRDPGFCKKEDIKSGSEAAAAGGVTSVACMPNTSPAIDSKKMLCYIKEKSSKAKVKIYPIAAITKGLLGKELVDFEELIANGAVGFSDDGRPVENAALLQAAMEKLEKLGFPIISHCEDLKITSQGIINKGKISQKLKIRGIDRTSEDSITAREIAIAAATNSSVHIAHVSTFGSVDLIRDAKRRGVKLSAETCPHYFMLTEEELLKKDADYRMNPPLRTEKDRAAVESALIDGTIDLVATDHAPHTKCEKANFLTAPNGVVGLETSLACVLTHFYHTKKLTLPEIVEKMSRNPCKILKIQGGKIQKGSPADIALVDLNQKWTVNPEKFRSRGKNSPFKGKTLTGKVVKTFCDGKLIFDALS